MNAYNIAQLSAKVDALEARLNESLSVQADLAEEVLKLTESLKLTVDKLSEAMHALNRGRY